MLLAGRHLPDRVRVQQLRSQQLRDTDVRVRRLLAARLTLRLPLRSRLPSMRGLLSTGRHVLSVKRHGMSTELSIHTTAGINQLLRKPVQFPSRRVLYQFLRELHDHDS